MTGWLIAGAVFGAIFVQWARRRTADAITDATLTELFAPSQPPAGAWVDDEPGDIDAACARLFDFHAPTWRGDDGGAK